MRVILPHTRLRIQVHEALAATGREWEARDVSGSDEAYWQLLSDLWDDAQTFAIVEHDVVVRPDSLDILEQCPSPWCAFRVPYVGTHWAGLSCVKFHADLIARVPDAIGRVASMWDSTHPPKHWCRIDAWLRGVLAERAGAVQCVHEPPLGHVRDTLGAIMPSHSCWR